MRRILTTPLAAVTSLALLATACSSGLDDTTTSTESDESLGADGSATPPPAAGGTARGNTTGSDGAGDAAEAPVAVTGSSGGAAVIGSQAASAEEGERAAPGDATFATVDQHPWVATASDALSTFAMDVDTASYTVVRQWLHNGWNIEPSMVRLEEFVNRFTYDYEHPDRGDVWSVTVDAASTPWISPEGETSLVRVGLQAFAVDAEDRPDATLTFVIDTSGSMDGDDRIGLVKRSLALLVERLRPTDRVAIVAYGSDARLLLRPTPLSEAEVVLDAIAELSAGGSTFAEGGLRLGYAAARNAFDPNGLNAVILASDGVANVGETGPEAILEKARQEAADGISLLSLGVGMGNFNDVLLERLANDGDGSYFYIDSDDEADRLFGDRLVATLMPVAAQAKVQVEFDEDIVTDWRLLGYENRALDDDEFRDDSVDAGEVGAGHQVTALFEVVLRDEAGADPALGATALTVQLRWADPDDGEVTERAHRANLGDLIAEPGRDYAVAVAAASFAELLRQSVHVDWSLGALHSWAQDAVPAATDVSGQADLAELLDLIRTARDLQPE